MMAWLYIDLITVALVLCLFSLLLLNIKLIIKPRYMCIYFKCNYHFKHQNIANILTKIHALICLGKYIYAFESSFFLALILFEVITKKSFSNLLSTLLARYLIDTLKRTIQQVSSGVIQQNFNSSIFCRKHLIHNNTNLISNMSSDEYALLGLHNKDLRKCILRRN